MADEQKNSADSQYSIVPIPAHRHTGTDSQRIDIANIEGFPSTPSPGDIIYRNANTWKNLPAGINGQFLKTLGVGADPVWGTLSQSSVLFGDGSDGDVTISADTTITQDMYYNNLTVNSGKILYTNGYRIFVKGTCTVTGTIHRAGNDGSGQTGGAGLSAGTLAGSAAGKDGGNGGEGAISGGTVPHVGYTGVSGVSVTDAIGNNAPNSSGILGGTGGTGGVGLNGAAGGAGGTAGTYSVTNDKNFPRHYFNAIKMCDGFTTTLIASGPTAGGAGGGGGGGQGDAGGGASNGGNGGYGAGSGGSGGVLFLACKTLAGNGTITVKGGSAGQPAGGQAGQGNASPGTGSGGGGGGSGACGGNGGIIILIYDTKTFTGTLTYSGGLKSDGASGGAGGAGTPNGSPGYTGQNGIVGGSGVLFEIN